MINIYSNMDYETVKHIYSSLDELVRVAEKNKWSAWSVYFDAQISTTMNDHKEMFNIKGETHDSKS